MNIVADNDFRLHASSSTYSSHSTGCAFDGGILWHPSPLLPKPTLLLLPFRKEQAFRDINQTWRIGTIRLGSCPHIKAGRDNAEGKKGLKSRQKSQRPLPTPTVRSSTRTQGYTTIAYMEGT